MSTETKPEKFSVGWILECGCDNFQEHCDQCDARREIVRLLRIHGGNELEAQSAE